MRSMRRERARLVRAARSGVGGELDGPIRTRYRRRRRREMATRPQGPTSGRRKGWWTGGRRGGPPFQAARWRSAGQRARMRGRGATVAGGAGQWHGQTGERKKGLLARGGLRPLPWATRRRRGEGSWTRRQALRRGVGFRACCFGIGVIGRHPPAGGGSAVDHIWQGESGRVTKVADTYCPISLFGPSPQGGGPLPPGASALGDGGQPLQDGAAHADGGHGGRTAIGAADGGASGARDGRSEDSTWHRASGREKGSTVQRRHGRRLRRGRSADRSQAGQTHDRAKRRRCWTAGRRRRESGRVHTPHMRNAPFLCSLVPVGAAAWQRVARCRTVRWHCGVWCAAGGKDGDVCGGGAQQGGGAGTRKS
eukprot:COSAG01_NODE_14092_length_1496_cov_41.167502_1_plen_366_part_00